MSVTRRRFIHDATCTGAVLALAGTLKEVTPLAASEVSQLAPYLTGLRMRRDTAGVPRRGLCSEATTTGSIGSRSFPTCCGERCKAARE